MKPAHPEEERTFLRFSTGCWCVTLEVAHFHSSPVCCPTSSEIIRPHTDGLDDRFLSKSAPDEIFLPVPRCWWAGPRFRISLSARPSPSFRPLFKTPMLLIGAAGELCYARVSIWGFPLFHYLNGHVIAVWISNNDLWWRDIWVGNGLLLFFPLCVSWGHYVFYENAAAERWRCRKSKSRFLFV